MKKILLLASAISALSSSIAFAETEDMFYVKANVGAAKFNKATDGGTSNKLAAETSVFFGAGVGYYVMDNIRTELTLDHYANPILKKNGVKHKGDINALMLNAYVDLFDVSVANVFIGGGVGMARVSEKITYADSTMTASSGQKNNFAYALSGGLSAELGTGVTAELIYSWKDFAKTKGRNTYKDGSAAGKELAKTHYKGHHVTVGFRFDL